MEAQSETQKPEKESKRAWYVVHTYSGYENKVQKDLTSKITSANMEDKIFNVVVPTEMVEEGTDSKGKAKLVERKIFPGYVLVDMIVNPRSWYVVRNTNGVTGFVGPDNKEPLPLSEEEADRILHPQGMVEKKGDVEVGDYVKVLSGASEGFEGKVASIDEASRRVTIVTHLFGGKETNVEADLDEVTKAVEKDTPSL